MDDAGSQTVGARRPGGRSARVRQAVLAATVEELAAHGYDGLSFENVAARAGVHKTTIYRRWPTKALLVAAAAAERSEQLVPVPDTGSLAGDLVALAQSVAANLTSEVGGRMARTVVSAAGSSTEVAAVNAAFWAQRFALTDAIVERAVERGELPPGTDSRLVIETLIGAMYVRLLLTGEPFDEAYAARAAAIVALGATAAGTPT
jgi:AcrR family transcriptional regulator